MPVVDDVSVDVRDGEVVGLVGATGGGKSTLGMLLVRLLDADGGTVSFDGHDLLGAGGAELKALRAQLQMLFQDPFESLSPRRTIADAVQEPLDVQGIGDKAARRAKVRSAMTDCRLPADDAFLDRHTHELSGGQLQRVALARALVLDPACWSPTRPSPSSTRSPVRCFPPPAATCSSPATSRRRRTPDG